MDEANNPIGPDGAVPDGLVNKVGAALREITEIRETYTQRLAAAGNGDEREAVEDAAQVAMVQAIDAQGLSVGQFNDVVSAAEEDPELGQRVLAAANAP